MATKIKGKYLETGTITETNLANNAATEDKINTGAVTETKIGTGAVVEAKIGTGAVTNGKLGADAVDGTKLADNAVDSEHITAGSVDNAHLSGSIEDSKLNQITTANKVAASAVEDKFIRNDGADSSTGKITANGFDASSQKITSVADGSANDDAVNYGQLNQVATQGKAWKETLLYPGQLSDGASGGIFAANVLVLSANLQTGDTISLHDGSSQENYIADTDFSVGVDINATLSNLSTAINAGAIAVSATEAALDTLDATNNVLVIWQDTIGEATRVFGNAAAAGRTDILAVADLYEGVAADLTALPTSDPAATNFGFSRAKASLATNETHNVRSNDSAYTWDGDAEVWNQSGASSIPYATTSSYGKVQISDGIAVASGIISVDVDDSTLDLTGTTPDKQVQIKDLGVVEGKIGAGAVTEAKIGTGAVTEAKIGTGAVTNGKLGADAVDGTKLADNAVDSEHITAGSVDNAHLSGSIEDSKLNQITTANKVAGSAVQLAADPGLEDSTGLRVKIKAAGGITRDSDGLSIDHSTIAAFKAEEHTITAGEITSKSFTLSATPSSAGEVCMDILTGCAQDNGTDFTVSGTTVSWTGLGLDGVIEAGEIVRMIYPI